MRNTRKLRPWMTLAERLGTFLAQIPRGSIDSIQLSYHGRLAEAKTELIRNSAIAGVLGHLEQVNRINAASVAQERGIRLHEEKTEEPRGATGSVLELRLHTNETSISASGAVLHGESPRLLHLDGIDIEAPLQGTLITIRNKDVPGVIGRVGTILGEHNVNIANFALGRANGSGQEPASALAVVQVDGAVTDEVFRELRASGAVLHGESPRLLHLDGIDIEAPLQGTLSTIRNKDVPGVIGRFGTILGEHNVNIANIRVGEHVNGYGQESASALSVVQVDGAVTDEVLRELRSVPASRECGS